MATGTKSESALKLLDMKDGDRLDLRDDWDHKFTKRQVVQNYLLKDANFALAFGENNVKSTGKFSARRDGNTITIDGTIRHVWREPYNFERGQPGAAEGHTLERQGKAKAYWSIAQWEQPIRAIVNVKDGKLSLDRILKGELRDLNATEEA